MKPAIEEREARFERLFNETRADLLAYTLRRVRSPEAAADVLSETFLLAWRKLESLPPSPEARLWLFGVARNILRQGATREHALDVAVQRLAGELHGAVPTFPHVQDEKSSTLRAALNGLPERQREVILLTAWEGLSPREIATATGTPVNLVRVRLHRARTRLQRELASKGEDAPWSEPPNALRERAAEGRRVQAALHSPARR